MTARVLFALAILAIGLSPLSPAPWVSLGLGSICAAAWGCAISRTPARRALWFNVAFAFVILTALEALSWRSDQARIDVAAQVSTESIYDSVPDDLLGYALRPSSSRTASKWFGRELVYRVRHTHGADGLRISAPPAAKAPSRPAVLLFGGSYTYGEGVKDEDAVPHVIGELLGGRYAVYNFGVNGYGPQQMLAAVDRGVVSSIVQDAPRVAIYQSIRDHVARVSGHANWLAKGPRYEMREGEAFHTGRLVDTPLPPIGSMRRLLLTSHLARRILSLDAFVAQDEVDLYAAVVDKARLGLEEQFPGIRFYVLLWDVEASALSRAMSESLEARGIRLLRVSQILPDYLDVSDPGSSQRVSRYDPHPNAKTHRMLAEFLAREIDDNAAR